MAAVDDDRYLVIRVDETSTMEEAREKVMTMVDERFPTDDPVWTVEVDTIGFSMGGLVTRIAADPHTGERHLRVARMFTISAPHLGAPIAYAPLSDTRLWDMRKGSDFLDYLNNEVEIDYELIPYTRLCDHVVHADNTAPPDYTPWWVSAILFQVRVSDT